MFISSSKRASFIDPLIFDTVLGSGLKIFSKQIVH